MKKKNKFIVLVLSIVLILSLIGCHKYEKTTIDPLTNIETNIETEETEIEESLTSEHISSTKEETTIKKSEEETAVAIVSHVDEAEESITEISETKESEAETLESETETIESDADTKEPEIKVVFTEIEETVYATGAVNIRKGPYPVSAFIQGDL